MAVPADRPGRVMSRCWRGAQRQDQTAASTSSFAISAIIFARSGGQPQAWSMEQDVLIIGGGAAGLSAAVALGRSRRSVTVLDAGSPRNAPAEGVHNFLTRDGTPPAELLALGRKEVEQYGGMIVSGEARHAQRIPGGFTVTADDGRAFTAR